MSIPEFRRVNEDCPYWLVWRVGSTHAEYKHTTEASARAEAERLAKGSPCGTRYLILYVENEVCAVQSAEEALAEVSHALGTEPRADLMIGRIHDLRAEVSKARKETGAYVKGLADLRDYLQLEAIKIDNAAKQPRGYDFGAGVEEAKRRAGAEVMKLVAARIQKLFDELNDIPF